MIKLRLPTYVCKNEKEVARRMIKKRIKAIFWMTANEGIDKNRITDMLLVAVLSWVDNIFMKTRRLFSTIESPVETSSNQGCRLLEVYLPLQASKK